MPQLESGLCLLQLRKSPCIHEDPAQPKINRKINAIKIYIYKQDNIIDSDLTMWDGIFQIEE